MRTVDMAKAMLEQAAQRLEAVRMALSMKGYAYAVRSAQECVELSLKAALRLVGVEYPKKHDVSKVLLIERRRFPPWFNVEEFAEVCRSLAEKREPAMYGDELRMIPSTELFTEQDAVAALNQAARICSSCLKLLNELSARSH